MEKTYLLHTKGGKKIFTADELIENAKQQKSAGWEPTYFYRHDKSTPPGYLVFSTWDDGAGVAIDYGGGKWGIIHAWQGDFCLSRGADNG